MSSITLRPSLVARFRAFTLGSALVLASLFTVTPALAADGATEAPPAGVVNINDATLEQLSWLPGVGPDRARRIVEFRTRRPFNKVAELARVKGIGLKTVRKLKPWLTVEGDTTLTGPVRRKSTARKSATRPAGADAPKPARRSKRSKRSKRAVSQR